LIDKRKDQRISKKFVVSYEENGFEKIGMTINISSNGLCLVSQTSLPVNKTVLLNLAMFDNVFEIMGLVRWSKSGLSKDVNQVPVGSGIKIINAPKGYFDYVDDFNEDQFSHSH
jgi:hypothetical protein